ncbi:unnamed protein product [Camellia sinensis]
MDERLGVNGLVGGGVTAVTAGNVGDVGVVLTLRLFVLRQNGHTDALTHRINLDSDAEQHEPELQSEMWPKVREACEQALGSKRRHQDGDKESNGGESGCHP